MVKDPGAGLVTCVGAMLAVVFASVACTPQVASNSDPPPRRFVARVVDESGESVAKLPIELYASRYKHRFRRWLVGKATSDSRGRIVLEENLEEFVDWSDEFMESLWVAAAIRDEHERIVSVGAVLLPALGTTSSLSDRARERDVGEIRIRPPALLASGRLVDDSGAPVAGALLSLVTNRWSDDPDDDPEELNAVVLGGEPIPSDPLLSDTTDADGRYVIRGDAPPFPLFLRLEESWNRARFERIDDIPLAAHAADLDLGVRRLGRVSGLVVASTADLHDLRVRLVGRTSSTYGVEQDIAADGTFELCAPAGAWTIKLRPSGEGVTCERAFEIEPGRTTTLDPIVLRAR